MMMQPSTLRYINLLVFSLVVAVLFLLATSWLHVELPLVATPKVEKPPALPFSFASKDEPSIGPPFLALEKRALSYRLPDLRPVLIYYGSNHRPDIADTHSVVNIGFRGNQASTPVMIGKPMYLAYESKNPANRWSFSPGNKPTSIWIEVTPHDSSAEISLILENDKGEQVTSPEELSHFTLSQMHTPTTIRSNTPWEIGGIRVDSSLLLRQRVAWLGQDLFLQDFGGEEYCDVAYKERLDFMDPEHPYHCYVGEGSCLMWDGKQWKEVTPGPESRGKPLLVAKKMSERTISFDLWDEEGKNKIPLELHKVVSPVPYNPNIDIKLIGARSKKDWIVSMAGVRIILKEDDWLLNQGGQWKKIISVEELDDYINGTTKGPLLVLQGTEKEGNDVSLVGTLFDETRTKKTSLKISLFKSWDSSEKSPRKNSMEDDDDEDDDDDDDDDFDDEDEDDDDDEDDEEVV